MTKDEGFLRRWARRKQAAAAAETAALRPADPPPPPAPPEPERDAGPPAVRGDTPESVPEIAPAVSEMAPGAETDPALELPPLESLTASSDFTAFLQKGVSAAVQSRALRVAWESDERIAGFRGMAEYAWDFNAPDYGKLWATDDVAKMVRQALRGAVPADPEEAPAPGEAPVPGAPPPEEPVIATVRTTVHPDPAPAIAEDPAAGEAVADPPEAGKGAGEPARVAATEDTAPRMAGTRRHGSALPG